MSMSDWDIQMREDAAYMPYHQFLNAYPNEWAERIFEEVNGPMENCDEQ